ncbi:DUF4124 domain-containing protein [Stenotrophomonas sp. SY1]|uniref:DUF4124 domain-containing protein n=1 Tax=Stenotrophomonas sp. SY1 TaxID=477235 RepID=UPI001E3798A2|nr:DUF4124 domain-containing protein [Stenotrophomonas sp. SY1]MCD9085656.1 DUF4124 domain-containing protein [Stenotrophomonas sp. SY1]
MLLPVMVLATDPPAAENVRIYRCVGANGAVALQDAPCRGDHRQQVLDMVRPKDPPPTATATPAPAPPKPAIKREVRVVTVQAPQPMYECVSAEGERYTSDNNEGNPRWVPVFLPYYRPRLRPPGPPVGNGAAPPPVPWRPGVAVPAGSVLVRDTCTALPQQEVCARLRDRRWELIRRYNSALQSERQELAREQRGIDARLNQDCGGS